LYIRAPDLKQIKLQADYNTMPTNSYIKLHTHKLKLCCLMYTIWFSTFSC